MKYPVEIEATYILSTTIEAQSDEEATAIAIGMAGDGYCFKDGELTDVEVHI